MDSLDFPEDRRLVGEGDLHVRREALSGEVRNRSCGWSRARSPRPPTFSEPPREIRHLPRKSRAEHDIHTLVLACSSLGAPLAPRSGRTADSRPEPKAAAFLRPGSPAAQVKMHYSASC
jgi:hypothetical protein